MSRLDGKNILVFGATGGIGSATAELLATRGARVAVTSRDSARAHALRDRLSGDGHIAEVLDPESEESVAGAMDRVRKALGHIDVLINIPGVSIPGKISDTTVESFDSMMSVNVRGVFLVCKHYIRQVDPAKGGQIIAISSVAGRTANPNAPVYCTAKAALAMLMSGMAMQVKQQNIKVTTLSPGAVTTKGFWGERPVPHDKFMLPLDVAEVVEFVCSAPPRVVFHELVFEPWEFFKSK